jgi:hypothetical protein
MWQMGIGPPYAKLYVQLIYDYLIYDYLNINVSYPNIARNEAYRCCKLHVHTFYWYVWWDLIHPCGHISFTIAFVGDDIDSHLFVIIEKKIIVKYSFYYNWLTTIHPHGMCHIVHKQ